MEVTKEDLLSLEKVFDQRFREINKKLDQIVDPETGVNAKVIRMEARIDSLESFKKMVFRVAMIVLTPGLLAMGTGLFYLIYMVMKLGGE